MDLVVVARDHRAVDIDNFMHYTICSYVAVNRRNRQKETGIQDNFVLEICKYHRLGELILYNA
jgi:hypothetical protein